MAIEHVLENYDFGLKGANEKKKLEITLSKKKCNQCDFASSRTGHFRRHMKTHRGEKSNKYNQ